MNTNFSQKNNSEIVIGEIKKKLSGFLLWIKNSHFDEQLTTHLQEIYSSYERELEELQKKYEVQESKLYLFSDEKSYLVELSLFLERLTSELEGYFYYDRFPKVEQEKSQINFHSQSYETLLDYLHHFLELDIKDALWKSYFSDYIGAKLYDFTQENFDPVETNQFYEELPDVFQQFFDKYFLLEVKKQLDTPPVLDYLKVHSIFDLSFDATLLNQLEKKSLSKNNEGLAKTISISSSSQKVDVITGWKSYPLTTLEQLIIEEDWSEEEIRDFVKKYYYNDKVFSTPFASFDPSEDIFFDFSFPFDYIRFATESIWNDYLRKNKVNSYYFDESSDKNYFHRQARNDQLVFGIRPILKVPEKEFDVFINGLKRKNYSVFYGEYPQYFTSSWFISPFIVVNSELTSKTYTCFGRDSQTVFLLPEYEQQNSNFQKYCLFLSGDWFYIINVSPVEWYVDYEHKLLISKNILFNGVTAMELDFRDQRVLTREMFIQKIIPLIQARLEQFAFDLIPKKYIQDSEKLNNEKMKCLKKGGFIDGKLQ